MSADSNEIKEGVTGERMFPIWQLPVLKLKVPVFRLYFVVVVHNLEPLMLRYVQVMG